MNYENTFMNFLLEHQMRHGRTLNFVILMESIVTAARYIEYYYHTGALKKNLGEAGQINVQGESVMRLDMVANQIVMRYLTESHQVIEATTEEFSDEVLLSDEGRYFVYFDPLDGSSNVKHSLPVGFLFGIGKRNLEGPEDYHLRKGSEFIAAGMFLIPAGIFTFTLRNSGTWRFVKDEAGIYIRPERVTVPETPKTWELSFNTANLRTYSSPVQKWIEENSPKCGFRYAGSLAVDLHRLLNNGGMFLYPAIINHPNPGKNRPSGKLRLMYECAVAAFIMKEAGGCAIDERGNDILEITPTHRHQRSALYIGNKTMIESVGKVLKENAAKA
jgi:fructose-1,6-bisphosphatase I